MPSMFKSILLTSASFALFNITACAIPSEDESRQESSVLEAQLSGTAHATIRFNNNTSTTATADSASFTGTVKDSNGIPRSSFPPVNGGGLDSYVEEGIGNV